MNARLACGLSVSVFPCFRRDPHGLSDAETAYVQRLDDSFIHYRSPEATVSEAYDVGSVLRYGADYTTVVGQASNSATAATETFCPEYLDRLDTIAHEG